jgi:hypothetical protein
MLICVRTNSTLRHTLCCRQVYIFSYKSSRQVHMNANACTQNVYFLSHYLHPLSIHCVCDSYSPSIHLCEYLYQLSIHCVVHYFVAKYTLCLTLLFAKYTFMRICLRTKYTFCHTILTRPVYFVSHNCPRGPTFVPPHIVFRHAGQRIWGVQLDHSCNRCRLWLWSCCPLLRSRLAEAAKTNH